MRKLCETLRQAMEQAGLRDGMTISFHHHLRNGDYVLNMVLDEAAKMSVKDLTVNASSVFDCYEPMLDHIRNGVVTGLETDYIAPGIGWELSKGILPKPIIFRTHGSRPADILSGRSLIDIAFIAAPASDSMGNCSGKYGPSACGSLGYAFADAMKAKKVVVITDHLMDYPLTDASITEDYVDYVVNVPAIGDPLGIVSGTTRMPKDPIALKIADLAAQAIDASGLLKDGFSFQTGAGGASLAVAEYLKQIMLRKNIKGSFALGGITGYIVGMLEAGCFAAIQDVQCFDLKAVESIREAEPIGPKQLLDVLVIAPCTGNTLAKLAAGIADTAVTMAAKAHLRNGRPVVVAVSTNDGLGGAARNIGELLSRKHYYFVPFRQDDPVGKPTSLVAEMGLVTATVAAALRGEQIQPLLLGPAGE